jgi:hypothetical protein
MKTIQATVEQANLSFGYKLVALSHNLIEVWDGERRGVLWMDNTGEVNVHPAAPSMAALRLAKSLEV